MLRFTRHPTGHLSSSWYNGTLQVYPGYQGDAMVYFVNGAHGHDGNNGLSWERPFATIQAALNVARYLPGTATIDDTKDHHSFVFVAPGHYNEQILFSGYNIHLIGCGCWPGKDYGVSINYDGAVGAPCALGFSGSGLEMANLHIHIATAFPGILVTGGDNNWIHDCTVECDGTNATYGMHLQSMKGSIVEDCIIERPTLAGIRVDDEGDDDCYFIDGAIRRNMIHADTAGVIGINVDVNNVCYNAVITENHIDVAGGGAGSLAIRNQAAANVMITKNMLVVGAGATPATSAGIGMLHNCASINGVVTVEFDDD